MSPRAVYRRVPHTIRHVPEGGMIHKARCTASGCTAESESQAEQAAAQDWPLRRTEHTGHDLFRRVVTDHARVTRDE